MVCIEKKSYKLFLNIFQFNKYFVGVLQKSNISEIASNTLEEDSQCAYDALNKNQDIDATSAYRTV